MCQLSVDIAKTSFTTLEAYFFNFRETGQMIKYLLKINEFQGSRVGLNDNYIE
jgi:hypothetical protein